MKIQEKLVIIIIIVTALIIPVNGYIQDDMDNLTKTNLSDGPAECGVGSYWYKVNPVGTQYTGANFIISGTTNLPAGQEINYMLQVSDIGPGSPELRPPSYTDTTAVIAGEGEINSWSAKVDTTKFKTDTGLQSDAVAGNYSLIIGPFCKDVFHLIIVDNSTSYNETFKSDTSLNSNDKTDSSTQTKKSPLPVLIIIFSMGLAVLFRR
ncbi:hypothetical protein Mpet_1549 [Methanolacinia petrolearia DSM 11571]|uniref:Uncharacterized protein n=1 Tax=Methanolacinia petrolearia (strain DSM 11571 / OCM 486 / SEBR 4847) TaxID=679926 RepID=E1RGL1_METP4|nr:hypothetical protein [Methanolacinia petrolearia]ADN36306.1 hypothetical protein Mpet_1549 [Methanolacinia petrolearia DSM 11571]